MTASETPKYDILHPVIQDRIDSLIEIDKKLNKYRFFTRNTGDDNEIKERYASMPKEKLYGILESRRNKLTEKMLNEHVTRSRELGHFPGR